MSLGKRLINTGGAADCLTETTDIFGDSSGVALYSLDYDASDESGSYDGTPTDVDFGVGGQINYGARFNGSSSKVTTSLDLDTLTDYTISMWIKIDASPSARDFFAGTLDSSAKNGIYLANNTDETIRFYERNASGDTMTITSTDTINIGSWNHIVAVRDGNTDYLYINNGTPVSASNSTITHATGFTFGIAGAYTTYFDGDIDQVRIFSKALSSDEVEDLFEEEACVHTATTTDNDFPTTNLAYYKLDNSAEDEKGSYDGTESNIEYRFGRFGQAAVFNGSSSKIVLPSSVAQQNNYTFSAWFKVDTLNTTQCLYSYNNPSSPRSFIFLHSGGTNNIRLFSQSANYYSSNNVYVANQWYHILYTKSSTNGVTVYLNNSVIINDATATSNDTPTTAGDNRIGGYKTTAESSWFDGQIDQVRIYSTALDSDQVSQLYNEKPETDTSNFKTVLYEGAGAVQYISNVGFQPDLVWIKNRDQADSHRIHDSIRGVFYLESDSTDAELNGGTAALRTFEANGFEIGTGASYNTNNESYVAWCWKGGGDAVSNTDGDIPSQVSANTDAGFSIVKYTGTGNASHTVGHGLTNNPPEMVIIKNLDGAYSWAVRHSALDSDKNVYLNATNAQTTVSSTSHGGVGVLSSSDFGFISGGTTLNNINALNNDYIAYCFHSVSGYSKIGTYTGNGTGQTIYTTDDGTSSGNGGFQPQFILIKATNNTSSWYILDAKRNSFDSYLVPNSSDAEAALDIIDINSNGFTLKGSGLNNSAYVWIYLAIA